MAGESGGNGQKTLKTHYVPPATPVFALVFSGFDALGVHKPSHVDTVAEFLTLRGVSFRIRMVRKRAELVFYVFLLIGVHPDGRTAPRCDSNGQLEGAP